MLTQMFTVFSPLFLLQTPAIDAASAQNTASQYSDQFTCQGSQGYGPSFNGRRTFLWRPQWLLEIKNAPRSHPHIQKIIRDADRALMNERWSVTDKSRSVPGATPNDYISIGPYWWPDPKKSDGLPYFRKDGDINPERRGPEYDTARLGQFANNVRDLALAYYITGDERYAVHAGMFLRAWYIDPSTRMNPDMNFAQAIPGRTKGRAEGIIDAVPLTHVIEAIGILKLSKHALSDTEHRAIEKWYGDLAHWLATSENGIKEDKKLNNHGVFYDYFISHFSLYSGSEDVLKKRAGGFAHRRLEGQMDDEGKFGHELDRTRSWHYSHYVLEGAGKLATIGECVNIDMWNSQTDDGRSLETAQDFISQYWRENSVWPFADIDLKNGAVGSSTSNSFPRVRLIFEGKEGASLDDHDSVKGLLP